MKDSGSKMIKIIILIICFSGTILTAEDFIQKGSLYPSASADYSYRTGYVWNNQSDINRFGIQFNFLVDYFISNTLGFGLIIGGGSISSIENDINSEEFGKTSASAELSTIFIKGGPLFNYSNFQLFIGIGADRLYTEINAFGLITESNQIYLSYIASLAYIIEIHNALFIRPETSFNLISFQEVYT
jgi:hypothetical protein